MSDWPSNTENEQLTPLFIHSLMDLCGGANSRGIVSLGAPAAAGWPTASLAIYVPLWLPFRYTVRRLFWHNGSVASGNSDIGVYTTGGGKVFTAGSTVCAGVSAPQFITPAAPFVLSPGRYFLAMTHSATTSTHCFGSASMTASAGRLGGLYQQASALPLPASATFAQFAQAYYPLFGITRTASGF